MNARNWAKGPIPTSASLRDKREGLQEGRDRQRNPARAPLSGESLVEQAVRVARQRHDQMLHPTITIQVRSIGKRVSDTHHDDEILLVQRLPDEPGRDVVDWNDRDINRACLQVGEDRVPGALDCSTFMRGEKLADADVDAGSDGLQFGQQRGQDHRREAIWRAERETARGHGRVEGPGGSLLHAHPPIGR